jgi:hypothetical protein
MNWLRARTVKELLALVAMGASIAGAAVLTLNRVWLIQILERAKQWSDIGDIAKLDTVIIGAIIVSLGFVIGRRTFKVTRAGIEASGGDDTPERVTTTTTETKG